MDASKLDKRVTILALTRSQGAAGGTVESWAETVTVSAEIADLRGGEAFAAAQVQSQMTTRFRMRWSETTSALSAAGNRLRYGGYDYDILQKPIELGRRDGIEILARARTD